MKSKLINSTLVVGTIFLSSIAIGQKLNETNAAVAYKNQFSPAFNEGDFETAKKALLKGKEAIDLAAEHAETKESQKTLYYKGAIYSGFFMVGTATKDSNFTIAGGANALDIAADALKSGFTKTGKMKSDIEDLAKNNQTYMANYAGTLYNEANFAKAAEFFRLEAKFADAINILDTFAVFNAALCSEKVGDYENAIKNYIILANANYRDGYCAVLASTVMRKNKQYDDAKKLVSEARKKYPTDKDLILESVNIYLDLKDPAGAEASLNEAIAADPNNKILHYVIGTVYSELKQNDKAEIALNKALEIDPNFEDAQYQLGAILIGWAADIRKDANALKPGDKKFDVMNKQADDIYKRALPPLEKYIIKNPNDKVVLGIMAKLYRSLGNLEKSAEFKKRADAAQ